MLRLKKTRNFGWSLMGLMMLGCSTTANVTGQSWVDEEPQPVNTARVESLYGIDVKPDKLWFLVRSTGCTTADSFFLVIEEPPRSEFKQVTIMREKPDLCRALPRLVGVEMPMPMSGGDYSVVTISNPFRVKPAREIIRQ